MNKNNFFTRFMGRLVAQVTGLVDLDQFSALLRCGVVVYSGTGRAVW